MLNDRFGCNFAPELMLRRFFAELRCFPIFDTKAEALVRDVILYIACKNARIWMYIEKMCIVL